MMLKTQKYSVNQHLIETILSWVKAGEIAIPEIQRPFVWEPSKVRDLMDSLYQGFPVGYIIAWKNANVKLKDGSISEGKKILIDGQQRITALTAAILGQEVINQDYKKRRIKISFDPIEEKFEVLNSAIEKNSQWIPDISEIFALNVNLFQYVQEYCQKNKGTNASLIFDRLNFLRSIVSKQIGLIELDSDLDIETVTEIFIRINSKGVALSQADFAMSKISVNNTYGGNELRKCIDYFCHLSISPFSYDQIKLDTEFANSVFFNKIAWLKNEKDDLYVPDYTDLLRVSLAFMFERGKLSDLVSLLSGRNSETRTYEEKIIEESFEKLKEGILACVNETNFKTFVMIIKSAGFTTSDLIRSKNTLNFAYILYLKLKQKKYKQPDIEHFVRRWFVLTILTKRYSASPESAFDADIKEISLKGIEVVLKNNESGGLSDAYWNHSLVQNLNTSVASSPYFNVYLAAQIKSSDKGFLSQNLTINGLNSHKGDIHHIFPKDYLMKNGLKRGEYNQIANYVLMQSDINIKISNKAPNVYMKAVKEQCVTKNKVYGGIYDINELNHNLTMNCIPLNIFTMDVNDYETFLEERRKLIAIKIKKYYFSL